ncbi:MAG: hypothetical protein RLZZ297_812 [Chloroflexota bacterium]|jgi:hypothetical protein
MWRKRVICCLVFVCASCSLWLPDAVPLSADSLATDTRVAAVLVADTAQPYLTPWVVLTPGQPPTYAPLTLPVTLSVDQRAALPWRTEAGSSYTPVIATIDRDAQGVVTLRDVDTTIREQTVATHDTQRLLRIIGTLQPRDGVLVFVDRRQKTMFLPFAPPLSPESPLAMALRRDSTTTPEHQIEGVVSGDAYIPLVLAPVVDTRP